MPFHPFNFKQSNAVMIGTETYTNKWNTNESMTVLIAKPVAQVIEEEITKVAKDVNMTGLRNFFGSFSADGLKNIVKGGNLNMKFDGKDIALKHGTHFFYDV